MPSTCASIAESILQHTGPWMGHVAGLAHDEIWVGRLEKEVESARERNVEPRTSVKIGLGLQDVTRAIAVYGIMNGISFTG
jgi:hypothetical protein